MRRILFLIIILLVVFSLRERSIAGNLGIFAPSASFTGFGIIHYEGEEGKGYDIHYTHHGFGMFFDSNLSQPRVYNFSIGLIYENVSHNEQSEYNLNRFAADMYFGFGLVKKRHFRLWLGPNLRIAYI